MLWLGILSTVMAVVVLLVNRYLQATEMFLWMKLVALIILDFFVYYAGIYVLQRNILWEVRDIILTIILSKIPYSQE